jgi:hypothetical protein
MCRRPGCVDAIVSSLCLRPLPVVSGLPAPCFHPANSCSRWQLRVLILPSSSWSSHSWGCWVVAHCSIVGSLPIVVVGMPPGHTAPSPPHEQLLTAAVGFHRPVLPSTICPVNSGEQRQWGSLFLPLILIMLPISTLQAGAGSGGVGIGCTISCFISWGVAMWQGSSYLVVIPAP